MKIAKKFAIACMSVMVLALGGCIETEVLKDGYDFGDVSITYCKSTSEAGRDVVRATANSVSPVPITLNYCKAIEPLFDGYDVGDISKAWCGADSETQQNIAAGFSSRLDEGGVVLNQAYCEVINSGKEPDS